MILRYLFRTSAIIRRVGLAILCQEPKWKLQSPSLTVDTLDYRVKQSSKRNYVGAGGKRGYRERKKERKRQGATQRQEQNSSHIRTKNDL